MTDNIQNDEGVEDADLDMSWIDVAVFDREGDECVIGYSSGFKDFIDGLFLCDSVEEYHAPTEPGAYRWSGFEVGSWNEGDAMCLSGGTWTPYVLASLAREPATADVERVALQAQEDAEDAREECVNCEGEGMWEHCPSCSLRFGRAIDMRRAILAAPSSERPAGTIGDGYADAFYELAGIMGIGASPDSPTTVWQRDMLPRLQAAFAPSSEPAIAEGERDSEWKVDCWNDFFDKHLTDGNDGYRAADVIAACRAAFDAAWPDPQKADADALAALAATSTPPASKGVEAAERLAARMGAEFVPASPTPSNDTLQGRGEVERLALEAIKAVTATTKDAVAGLSRIMAIAGSAGVKAPYSELLKDPRVALIVERPRVEWKHLFEPECTIPPEGWRCTRKPGHDGPCAALQKDTRHDG